LFAISSVHHAAKLLQCTTTLIKRGLKYVYRKAKGLILSMKALFTKGPKKRIIPRRKTRQRSKYIYCRTKNGPRIISRQSPRQHHKFIICSVSSTTGGASPDDYKPRNNDHQYDSDSYNIGIDNHASYCLTNNLKDFEGTPVSTKVRIKGIKGHLATRLKGTIKWHLLDDDGVEHELLIPNSYYAPDLPVRLLSPQHLAQVLKPSETIVDGTAATTYTDRVILEWFNRQYSLTVLLNSANVAVFRSAPRYDTYEAFEATLQSHVSEPRAFAVNVIPNDDTNDDDGVTTSQDDQANSESATPTARTDIDTQDAGTSISLSRQHSSSRLEPPGTSSQDRYHPDVVDFSDDDPGGQGSSVQPNVVPYDDEEYTPEDPRQELLLWHYRLGHVPMSKLQHMASQGDLPSRLATIQKPECAAC
jgi:hypothetical protein